MSRSGISLASRAAHDALTFESALVAFLKAAATDDSAVQLSQRIYRELVAQAASRAESAIYVDCAWDGDGRAVLSVEDIARSPASICLRPPSEGSLEAFSSVPAQFRLRHPTLLGTLAQTVLPIRRRAPSVEAGTATVSPSLAAFKRMQIGRWIERHSARLGDEAYGILTSEGAPPPPHDQGRFGHSEGQMVAEIGRAVYFGTVPLWLRDVRWLFAAAAARDGGKWTDRLTRAWQAAFGVIGAHLPVPDTGILARMRDLIPDVRGSATSPEALRESTPAAEFFASFASQEGPLDTLTRLRARGWSDEEIFRDVMTPAQLEIGRRWQLGQMSPAQERVRSSVVRALVARGSESARPGGRFCVVAACTPNERHTIGLEMLVTLLRARGVRVYRVEAPATSQEILRAAVFHRAGAVILSATMSASVYKLIELVDRLRRDPRTSHVPVLVGGEPFVELPELRAVVGAESSVIEAADAVRFCAGLRDKDEAARRLASEADSAG